MPRESLPELLLVDAHAHLHSVFARADFLDAARRNLAAGAAELALAAPWLGCLLLADPAGADSLDRLRADEGAAAGWRCAEAGGGALFATRGGDRLLLVGGRQVVTREGLEVLALGAEAALPDGEPLAATLARVAQAGGVAVLPWGFGKWWGRRGALAAAALAGAGVEAPGTLFLGDNAGRPRLAPRPRLFRAAAGRGVPVLPGSDPLPLAGHASRAGCRGALLRGRLDADAPASSLVRLLRELRAAGTQPPVWGRGRGLLAFVRDQSALRLAREAA